MQIIRNLDALSDSLRDGVVTLGKFDGVHLGHAQTIRCVKNRAAQLGAPAIVMTFDPSPIHVLNPDADLRNICTLQRKAELIQAWQPDALIILQTTPGLLKQNAEFFFFDTFQKKLHAKTIVEGHNFVFGRNQSGNAQTLRHFGIQAGIEIDILEPVCLDAQIISSSRIRSLLREGLVEEANKLMTQPYRMTGTVVTGDRRGRTLGFPTANLADVKTIIPEKGLYATVTYVDEMPFTSTTHVGPNPTFEAADSRIETFLHDFNGNLYGKRIAVDFHARLRDSIRFDSAEELIRQMKADVDRSKAITAKAK